ncbi:MAG TPA: DUF4126 family protein [Blastocatellia bacterium]|jgi:uncharacterized membrane protein|nr:DUF4126 family protein [Blastocatellia bacterium]
MTLLFAFLIGLFAGLRSFTAPAVTAWAAYLGWLKLERPLSLIASLPAVVILTVFAIGELFVDKHPKAPNRTDAMGVIARILTGGLTGACVATAGGEGAIIGAVLGAVGGVVGCFTGFQVRTRLVKAFGTRDIYIALIEDIVAIGGSLWVVSRF